MPLDFLKETVAYWRDSYVPNFKAKHEATFNQFPMFLADITYIDSRHPIPTNTWSLFSLLASLKAKPAPPPAQKLTLKVHFVHARSPRADATPLIMLHGWPGSYLECAKMIPLLTNPHNKSGA